MLAGRCISPGSALRKVITRANRQAMQERHDRRINDLLQEKLGSDACHAIDVPEWLVQTEPEPTTETVAATATETASEAATDKPANDNAGNIATTAYPESEAIARLSEPLPDTFTRSGADAAPWHRLRPRPDSHFVQLDPLSTARVGKLARAHCFAYSPQEQDASFVLGADYWLKFSINGVALIDHSRQPRGIGIGIITPAEFKTQAHLRAGWNRLEITLISGSDGFGFACFCAAAHALRFALSDGDSAPATADAPADVPTDANA